VLAQLPQDLVHLERGDHRLDQRRGFDRSLRHAQLPLGELEISFQSRAFEMGLDLRKVEIRPGAACKQFLAVVEEIQREVEYRT